MRTEELIFFASSIIPYPQIQSLLGPLLMVVAQLLPPPVFSLHLLLQSLHVSIVTITHQGLSSWHFTLPWLAHCICLIINCFFSVPTSPADGREVFGVSNQPSSPSDVGACKLG